ncbi:hypothetical protein BDF22DRAFT_676457 [Syncephalis plumigaleata]|nr:hypothetical protein BDF22DRAFT_676457 [Syncephalis plumigaleata]
MVDTADDSDAETLVQLKTVEENVHTNKTIIESTIRHYSIDKRNGLSTGIVSTTTTTTTTSNSSSNRRRASNVMPVKNIESLDKSRLLSHIDILLVELIQFLDDHGLLLLASTCQLLYRHITSHRILWAYRYQRAFSLGMRVYRVADHTYKARSVDERELAWLRWWWRCEQIRDWHQQDAAISPTSPNAELDNLYSYMTAASTSSNPKLLLNWHRAYIARLLVEFNLRNGLFKRKHGTISIPTIMATPSKTRTDLPSNLPADTTSSSPTESHGWIMRPVGLWGTIIRHPHYRQFALLRHLPSRVAADSSIYDNSPNTPPYPSMHITLLDWCGLNPTRAWCKITESYLLAAESFLARQLQVWLLKPPRFSGAVDDEPNIPFLVDVPGQLGDRFGISVHGNWCLVYIRPCNTRANSTYEDGDMESTLSPSTMTSQQRRIYAYHLPTRLWSTGWCVGREGQAHLQTLSHHCVFVYTCHVEDTYSVTNTDIMDIVEGNSTNGHFNSSNPSDATPAWMLRQQIIRWRVWELGLYTEAPRCVASGYILQNGRPSRWIHACRVDDSRVVLYTSRDIDVEDMLLMHNIHQLTKNKWNASISSNYLSNGSSTIENDDEDSVLWRIRIRGILTVTPMLSVGYICVHDRMNRIQLLSMDTGIFIHSLLFDGHRPAGQLIGRTYLMNLSAASSASSASAASGRNSSRRSNRSKRRPPINSSKQPSFEKGASQVLDLERGMSVHSIDSMISSTHDDEESTDTSRNRKQNWEVCCNYALRISDVRTTTNESTTSGDLTTTDIDLEWLEFTDH